MTGRRPSPGRRLPGITRFKYAIAGLAVTAVLAAPLAVRADQVTASGEMQDDYARLTFEWPTRVRYSAEKFGSALVLRFNRPIDNDLSSLADGLGEFVTSVSKSGNNRDLILNLAGNHRFRTGRDGNRVIIDIVDRTSPEAGRPIRIASSGGGAAPSAPAAQAQPSTAANQPASPASQSNAPPLRVRVGEHPQYDRLVFDWTNRVGYQIVRTDGLARVDFDKPARVDDQTVIRRLPDRLKGFSTFSANGGLVVRIPTEQNEPVRDLRSGTKVVIDVYRTPGPKPKAAPAEAKSETIPPPQPQPQASPAVPPATNQTPAPAAAPSETAAANANTQPAAAASGIPAATTETPPADQSATATVPAAAPTAPVVVQAIPGADGEQAQPDAMQPILAPANNAAPSTQAPPAAGASSETASPQPNNSDVATHPIIPALPGVQPVDQQAAAAGASTQSQEGELAAPVGQGVIDITALPKAQIGGPQLPVTLVTNQDAYSLRFDWPTATAASVFTRAGFMWVVFDTPVIFDVANINSVPQQMFGTAQQVPATSGSVLRMALVPGINPRVWRDGLAWIIDLAPQAMNPDVPLQVDVQMVSPQGPRIFFPVEGVGRVTTFLDPEVGDRIIVAPIAPLSRGIDGARNFSQLEVLGSIQGIAVRPEIDKLEVRVLPDGVAITSGKGLMLSRPVAPSATVRNSSIDGLPPGLPPGRIFDMAAWRRGDDSTFLREKQAIQSRISDATSIARSGPRLELGQFYFAHGLSAEAMGLFRTISNTDEELSGRPQVRALRGAVEFMLGRYRSASKELAHRSLKGISEAELWRGAAAAALGRWEKAVEHFARAGEIPGGYPRGFTTELALLAAEAAIRVGDYQGAGAFLDVISEGQPTPGELKRLNFLRGRVLYEAGDVTTALDFWRRLADGVDRWSRVRAERALVEHGLREGELSPLEAINRLEALRFTWRGDRLEFELLHELGQLYLQEKDYENGLEALRQAVKFFPNDTQARAVTAEMTNAFREIYTEGAADAMTPLSALSLYDQFRELTPVGKTGDEIIQRLADRLVQVDLLDRASILLERQVKFRLQGVDKARVGARLAVIRMLDRKPDEAIEALDESVAPGLTINLANERARLRSRSVFELGDSETALRLMRKDQSREADLLRADIYWRDQRWREAAEVFARLVGDAGQDGRRIDSETATFILNWAVSLSLNDDEVGLRSVRQRFAVTMDNTPYREAFRLITNSTESDVKDFLTLTKRFEEIGRFQAFLTSYREKLKSQPLSATN